MDYTAEDIYTHNSYEPVDRPAALLPLEALLQDTEYGVNLAEDYMNSQENVSLGDIPPTPGTGKSRVFVLSEYAEVENMTISKRYTTSDSGKLLPYSTVQAQITIVNNTNEAIHSAEYLDTLPAMFSVENTQTYRVVRAGEQRELPIQTESFGDFDLRFHIGDIGAGETITIEYAVSMLPVSYGEMKVGDFEEGTAGHDPYGDILFHTSTTCGAESMQWLSTAARSYTSHSGAPSIPASIPLPADLAAQLHDANNNGIPDSIENASTGALQDAYRDMTSLPSEINRDILEITRNGNSVTIGFNQDAVNRIEDMASEIFNGLACGFGGGSCLSFPINWAPLAPGNDPVLFGYPIGDGFHPLE